MSQDVAVEKCDVLASRGWWPHAANGVAVQALQPDGDHHALGPRRHPLPHDQAPRADGLGCGEWESDEALPVSGEWRTGLTWRSCSPDWTRTNNPAINSRMLCQLSYGGRAGVTRALAESTARARASPAGTSDRGGRRPPVA